MTLAPYKLNPGGVVTLFEINFASCISFVPTGTTTLRISPYRNGESDIVYNTNTYSFVGAQISGLRSEINATAPKPTLTLDKASLYSNSTYQALKAQFQTQTGGNFFDWRGAQVTIIKYYVNGAETLYSQEYIVNQVTSITSDAIQVELAVSLGIDNLANDSVQTLSLNRCSLKYRTWNATTNDFDYTDEAANGCPYGNPAPATNYSAVPSFGIKFFTSEDVELLAANKQYDECSQTVKGCSLRFDPSSQGLNLPYKGLWSPTAKLGG